MKKSLKRALAILLISALALSVFACGTAGTSDPAGTSDEPGTSNVPNTEDPSDNTNASNDAPTKDTVVIAVTQDSGTLDPTLISGNDILNAVQLVYDQLWYIDENGDDIMMLATGRERLDELTYRIHLREGVTFTNGNAFEADDVMFSLDHANNRFGQPAIVPQLDLENSKIIDPYTVELVFTVNRYTSLQSIGGICMIDKQTSEADPETMSTQLVGTGPYVISEYVVNSHLNLTQKDEYWGTMPAIKNYSFVQLKEESQRVNAIETGEVDVAAIPYQDIEYVKSLPGVKIDQALAPAGLGLYFNIAPSSAFYENIDARLAVAYAVDRSAINNLACSGMGRIPNAPVDGTATDGDERMFNLGIYADDYNLELAKQLAESSGLAGKTVRLINNGSSADAMTSELIQADCKKVGITVEVISLDMGTWLTNMYDENYYDMCIDIDPIASDYYSGSYYLCYDYLAAMSYVNYDFNGKDRAREIITEVMGIDDIQVRTEMNNELAKICVDNMLWFNLVSPPSALGMSDDLQGTIRNAYNFASLFRNLYWG